MKVLRCEDYRTREPSTNSKMTVEPLLKQSSQTKLHTGRELANFKNHHRDNYDNTREIT